MRGEWVTRLRAPSVADPYSGELDVPDWSAASECAMCTTVPPEPLSSVELIAAGRESVTSGFRLYLSTRADVLTTDRFLIRGEVFRVEGEPALWSGSCLVVELSRIEG